MIDTKLLLRDLQTCTRKLEAKGVSKQDIDSLVSLSLAYKEAKTNVEKLQATQNALSKTKPDEETKAKILSLVQELKSEQENLKDIESKFEALLLGTPNLIDDKTPIGKDESENLELKRVLTPPTFSFTPKAHWELAEKNGWIDFENAAKIAKSRFNILRGMAAKLNFALISYMLEFNQSRGFEYVHTPVLVNANALLGTGQLPKFKDDMFKLENTLDPDTNKGHELYLISTSEISLTNIYQDTIIPYDELPLKLTSYTPCFRKEAGSAGRDTRGIIRQHQFDKVELVSITSEEDSEAMQAYMIETASLLLERLGLPHRLVQLCSGDLGFSASNTVDLEVWFPSQDTYREISSVSNCRDFQARRAKIRYKQDGKNKLAHTLNGSSLAVGRTLAAIMENYQDEQGNIKIPKVLEKYMPGIN
ncbi:serine--tRNA ligase [Helicobacter sp. 11S02629-2]|uniref:serine--tRNA ligase n=1 Tax=Helicobacter sp. 11S02629-2 TaxID=1476195 RepID=UPI000BA56351|nr:serine--tRNA ligase [Helicobacter sp. 11S02629-2]PAF45958.1 serine--tRNA ligase [Helicobacter sp. 11S02629-2]